jgi:hypothetical protein
VDVMERARKAFEAAGVPFEVEEHREGEHRLIFWGALYAAPCKIMNVTVCYMT